jgi:hypothetical protein
LSCGESNNESSVLIGVAGISNSANSASHSAVVRSRIVWATSPYTTSICLARICSVAYSSEFHDGRTASVNARQCLSL